MEYVPKYNMYIACPLQMKDGFYYGTFFVLIFNRSPLMLFIDVELTSFFYLPIRSLGLWVSKTVNGEQYGVIFCSGYKYSSSHCTVLRVCKCKQVEIF